MNEVRIKTYAGGNENRPIKFVGELLAQGQTYKGTGVEGEVAVYRTNGGKFIRHNKDWTCWDGQHSSSTVDTADTLEALDLPEWAYKEALETMGEDPAILIE